MTDRKPHSWHGSVLALALLAASGVPAAGADAPQPLLVSTQRMTLETALRVARGALDACRKEGIQVGVTVVDRSGQPQVVLRDVLAPDLTLRVSREKAYTAVSFNSATSALESRSSSPFSVGKVAGLLFSPGGVPIHAGGSLVGAVGVSGAPDGKTDEMCARAGVLAVSTDLDMEGM